MTRSGSGPYYAAMETSDNPAIRRLVARATDDADILAVILFGSRARVDSSPGSDYDVCLVLAAGLLNSAAAEKRLDYLAGGDLDVVLFHQLPLNLRSRVLREGQVLYARDEDALYAPRVPPELCERITRVGEDHA